MTIKTLRESSGMTQREFSEYFGVSKRSVESWEGGQRECPEYLLELMEYKLKNEGIIKVFFDQSFEEVLKKTDEERWKIINATSYFGNATPEELSDRVKEFEKHIKSEKAGE